jgi:hypothetical protein
MLDRRDPGAQNPYSQSHSPLFSCLLLTASGTRCARFELFRFDPQPSYVIEFLRTIVHAFLVWEGKGVACFTAAQLTLCGKPRHAGHISTESHHLRVLAR